MSQQPQFQIPIECAPQPLPSATVVQVDPVHNHVVLVVFDASGQRLLFFPPEQAAQLGQQLLDAAPQARTGLIVQGGGL